MSNEQKGVWIYDFVNKCFKWVVNNRAYEKRGDEHKPRPHFAPPVVKPHGEKKA